MTIENTVVFQKNWEAIHALTENGVRKYRYIINEGSSRSSKTYSLIDCFDLYARSNSNKRLTAWRDTKTDIRKTVLNDTLKRLKSTNRYKQGQDFNKTESIFSYTSESTFEMHGTDDEETVHGLTQDAAWLNEPYKISRDTFDQIDQRTSDFIFLDWNPKKDHWIDDLKKDPRTIVIHSTFKDNPFCPTEQRTKILSYQPIKRSYLVENGLIQENECISYNFDSNPKNFEQKHLKELLRCVLNEDKRSASITKWDIYGLGVKAERPNRIFNWKEISYFEYLKIEAKSYIGVDWGKVDAFGIVEAKYYDGKLYLHELNYLSEDKWKDRLTPLEHENIKGKNEGFVTWLFTKLNISKKNDIICDTNRPLKISALRYAGWERAVGAPKIAGSILDGIDLLENLDVYYTDTSKNIAYEQENYSREVDKYGVVQEEPEDKDNHLIDPTRYIALYLQKIGIIKKV
jgi:phage terminase large subunit